MKNAQKWSFVALGFVVVMAAVVGAKWMNRPSDTPTKAVASPARPAPSMVINRHASTGWSANANSELAIREAIAMARTKLGGIAPAYAFVACTGRYDVSAIHATAVKELGAGVRLHGVTSGAGVYTEEGWHIGDVGSVAVLLVPAAGLTFGVGGADLAAYESGNAAGRAAIEEAIADAGMPAGSKPKIILINGTWRRGERRTGAVLDGIAEIVGPDVPVMGGNAGDEDYAGQWRQFTRDKFYTEGVVMTAVFTDRKVGWSYECGFGMTNRSGVVTKSDGVDVYEIDNRPALEVYNEWTDGKAYDVVREPKAAHGGWLVFTAQHPLGKPVNSPHGQVGQLVIKVALNKASLDKKDLPCAAPVEQGSRIWLLSGSWQALLNRAEYGPRKAMEQGGIASGEQAFGVGFFCQGAQPMLPPEELPKFSLLLNEGTGGAPFIGMLTLGEQGPIVPGWKNASANLVQSMVMVGQ